MQKSPAAPDEAQPTRFSESDPQLLWALARNSRREKTILGRRVVEETDDFGCRPVLGQPASGEKTLAAYGCSFTFGTALPFEETFCSVLQSMFPAWRIENFGAGGYSTVQSLIKLRRNDRWVKPEYVVYGYLADHARRNVADIAFRRHLVSNRPRLWKQGTYPRARLAADGSLVLCSVSHPRGDLDGIDMSDFDHDQFYLDMITAAVLDSARGIVEASGGHFFVTVMRGQMSPYLSGRLMQAGIPVLDLFLQGQKFTCMPDDGHPNTLANRIYAERIRDYILARETAVEAAVEAAIAAPGDRPDRPDPAPARPGPDHG